MAILDKLVEKKDILIYIRARRAEIARLKREEIPKLPERQREMTRREFMGRGKELEHLRYILSSRNLKSESLELWSKNWKEIKKTEVDKDAI